MVTVGDRILVAGDAATVRYVGEIDGQEGTWVGVEWDNPARGKHDGSTGGKKYFTVESGHATGGSFIRATKVDAGVSLLEAIEKKYRPAGGIKSMNEEGDELYAVTARGDKKAIELVGMEKIMKKQSVLEQITGAYVPDFKVTSRGGEPGDLGRLCPNLEALDLSGNFLADWALLDQIVREFPKLTTLHVSRMQLPPPPQDPAQPLTGLARLRVIVFNHAPGLTWDYLIRLAKLTPNLEELHVGFNHLPALPVSTADPTTLASIFSNLKVLNLESNKLTDWEQIWALRTLPKLKSLNLNDNALTSLHYAPAAGEGEPFASLEALFIGGNKLEEWAHVDAVHRMPRVVEARFSGNPVVEKTEWAARYELIARVGKLKVMNGSTVGPMERRDCEVRYIRNCEAERLEKGHTVEQISLQHPRYPELASKYASFLTSVSSSGGNQAATLASEIVNLRLTCVSAAQGAVMGTFERKLPLSTRLDKVKMVCERLFKIPAAEIVLFVRAPEEPVPEHMGVDESRDLAFFNCREGSELLVDSVTVDDRAEIERKKKEAARKEQEEREKKQLYDRDSVVQRAKDEDYY